MAVEYIRNRNGESKALKYDPQSGPLLEVHLDGIKDKLRKKGCYVRHGDDFLGVIGTRNGPVLFVNDTIYPFSDSSWTPSIEKKGTFNQFLIKENGNEVLRLNYSPSEVDELDPWSDEQSVDFYLWVVNKKQDDEFFEMWTVSSEGLE